MSNERPLVIQVRDAIQMRVGIDGTEIQEKYYGRTEKHREGLP
jgi:hypothetical protein